MEDTTRSVILMNAFKFREQAVRARRLAVSVADAATAETLGKYAEECDARAADIEAREASFRVMARAHG